MPQFHRCIISRIRRWRLYVYTSGYFSSLQFHGRIWRQHKIQQRTLIYGNQSLEIPQICISGSCQRRSWRFTPVDDLREWISILHLLIREIIRPWNWGVIIYSPTRIFHSLGYIRDHLSSHVTPPSLYIGLDMFTCPSRRDSSERCRSLRGQKSEFYCQIFTVWQTVLKQSQYEILLLCTWWGGDVFVSVDNA